MEVFVRLVVCVIILITSHHYAWARTRRQSANLSTQGTATSASNNRYPSASPTEPMPCLGRQTVKNKPSSQYEQVNLVWHDNERNMAKLGRKFT